jgi:hypothetical protein
VLLVVLRSSKRPILKDIGGNMLFHGESFE